MSLLYWGPPKWAGRGMRILEESKFIHQLFTKYLLRTFSVLGTLLSSEDFTWWCKEKFLTALFMQSQGFKAGKTLGGYHLSKTMLSNILYTRTALGKINMFTIYILLVHSKWIQSGIVLLSSLAGRDAFSKLSLLTQLNGRPLVEDLASLSGH